MRRVWLLVPVVSLCLLVTGAPLEARGEARLVRVPDVLQLEASVATSRLARAGLVARLIGRSSGSGERITVGQNPAAGRMVRAGATVRVTYRWSRVGSAPPASPGSPKVVSVPNVIGSSPSAAIGRLRRAGLGARVVSGSSHSGVVTAQNPAAGQEVRRGAQVRLTVRTHRR
jgi:beta-lactam-binding protein with PASTA domain